MSALLDRGAVELPDRDDGDEELPEASCVWCRGEGSVALFPDECGIGCCSERCPVCRGDGLLLIDGGEFQTLCGVPVKWPAGASS